MSAVLKFDYGLEKLECCNCFMVFAVPPFFIMRKRDDHGAFYCPNGHSNYFPAASEAEKLKKQLEQEREQHQQRLEFERNQTASVRRELIAVKGQLTKTKKRVAKGICPCCNRSFADSRMARHIATKHPEFVTVEK